MTKKEKHKLVKQILISSTIIISFSIIIVLIDSCYPSIINITALQADKSLILRVIIQAIGLFLGFIITALVMKFNQLDALIQKLAEDLNCIMNTPPNTPPNNLFRGEDLIQKKIEARFKTYELTNPLDIVTKKRVYNNYIALNDFRAFHKAWFNYPLYYSLTVIFFAFFLLFFQKTIPPFFFNFMLSLCFLMTLWNIYINVIFVSDFLENAFANDDKE